MRITREHIEWCDVWIPSANAEDASPRVLLVGDSITRAYYPSVREQLEGELCCARLTTSACVADPAFHLQMEATLSQYSFSILHFNNGLHGPDYTEEEYRDGYAKALRWIREHMPLAKLILVLSTPLLETSDYDHLNPRIDERNRMVRELAETYGAAVHDLHALCKGHPEYYSDAYHFNPEAVELQAQQVGESIRLGAAEMGDE